MQYNIKANILCCWSWEGIYTIYVVKYLFFCELQEIEKTPIAHRQNKISQPHFLAELFITWLNRERKGRGQNFLSKTKKDAKSRAENLT